MLAFSTSSKTFCLMCCSATFLSSGWNEPRTTAEAKQISRIRESFKCFEMDVKRDCEGRRVFCEAKGWSRAKQRSEGKWAFRGSQSLRLLNN